MGQLWDDDNYDKYSQKSQFMGNHPQIVGFLWFIIGLPT